MNGSRHNISINNSEVTLHSGLIGGFDFLIGSIRSHSFVESSNFDLDSKGNLSEEERETRSHFIGKA